MASRTTKSTVMIEWRTKDKWHGIQQTYPKKHVDPKGALDVGQKVTAYHGGLWHDAIIVESGKSTSTTKAKRAYQPVQPKPQQTNLSSGDESSEDDDIPLKTIQTELKTANTEKAFYDDYISQRDKKLTPKKEANQEGSTKEKAQTKRKLYEETTVPTTTVEVPMDITPSEDNGHDNYAGLNEAQPNRTFGEDHVYAGLNEVPPNSNEPATFSDDRVHADFAGFNEVPPNSNEPATFSDDRVHADFAGFNEVPPNSDEPPTFSEGHVYPDYANFDDWWAEHDEFNKSDIGQVSEDVRTIKDWVEGLHRKSDMIYTLMSAMERRLDAIEAGISLVPLPSQILQQKQQPHQIPSQSVPRATDSVTTTDTPMLPASSTSSSNYSFALPAVSTPVTPTQPRPLSSGISPIVHSLPKAKADRLKRYKWKSNSRKIFTRKVLVEFFNAEEMSTSNISGSGPKDKLDETKIALVERLVLAAFPPIPGVEDLLTVKNEIRDTINLKCREMKRESTKNH